MPSRLVIALPLPRLLLCAPVSGPADWHSRIPARPNGLLCARIAPAVTPRQHGAYPVTSSGADGNHLQVPRFRTGPSTACRSHQMA